MCTFDANNAAHLMDRDLARSVGNIGGRTTPRDKRIRVFYLSYTPPVPTWGGAMSFYRHFVERNDFEIFVATDSPEVQQYQVPYRFLRFDVPKWLHRMLHTRLYRWFWHYEQLVAGYFVPHQVWQAARIFKPDLVFTIAGTESINVIELNQAQLLREKFATELYGSGDDSLFARAILWMG